MLFNRRAVLMTLASVPAVSLLPASLSGWSGGPYVNILLHGLFMMEFQDKNKLVIATPNFHGHEFKMRRHDQLAKDAGELPEVISLEGQVKAGKQYTFAPENLQFPASDLGGAGYKIDYKFPTRHNHRCTMVLPLPCNIIGLRPDKKEVFQDAAVASNIKTDILSSSNGKLATITCLQYEPADGVQPFVMNYYAEHKTITLGSINAALTAAQDVCGDQFNLEIQKLKMPPPADSSFPDGVDKNDEDSLHLLLNIDKTDQTNHVDVASCPQFGIRG